MKNKIGWQKYEDVVEQNLSSPMFEMIMHNIMSAHKNNSAIHDEEYEEELSEDEFAQENSIIPLSPQLIEEISMLSNFDCWMGHTNFDITPRIRETLDKVEGIELLKICSRYRFFIGVGRMFDFKEVRKKIENILITKEN
jgi:hypothetical protein